MEQSTIILIALWWGLLGTVEVINRNIGRINELEENGENTAGHKAYTLLYAAARSALFVYAIHKFYMLGL